MFESRQSRIDGEQSRLRLTNLKPTRETNAVLETLGTTELTDMISIADLLRRPEVTYRAIVSAFPPETELEERDSNVVETEIKFEGYLKRQDQDIERVRRMESVKIPADFSYSALQSLSVEVREKLDRIRPQTLGQASRISGVTPAAVSLLSIFLKRGKSSPGSATA